MFYLKSASYVAGPSVVGSNAEVMSSSILTRVELVGCRVMQVVIQDHISCQAPAVPEHAKNIPIASPIARHSSRQGI